MITMQEDMENIVCIFIKTTKCLEQELLEQKILDIYI